MFWGRERKERLHKVIFGDPSIVLPESKTFINGLYNMITLSRDSHGFWGGGYFILEPLDEASSQYELKARFEWIPQRSGTGGVKVDTNPATFETLPFGAVILTDAVARTFVENGHTITFRTNDPVNAPLPDRDLLMLQGFLIRVLRLAGRAGDDMLGTVESDDGVSVAAGDITQLDHSHPITDRPPLARSNSSKPPPTMVPYPPGLSGTRYKLSEPSQQHTSVFRNFWLRFPRMNRKSVTAMIPWKKKSVQCDAGDGNYDIDAR
jgi:hypothetical protein